MTLGETFTKNLRQWRNIRGLTMRGLARASGVSVQTISTLERFGGATNLDVVERLSKALAVPVATLLSEESYVKLQQQIRDLEETPA